MATPRRGQAGENLSHPIRQPSRWPRNLLLLALVLAAILLAWGWNTLRRQALTGAAFAARAGCVCRFVSQRSLAQCESDLQGDPALSGVGRLVTLSDDAPARIIHAGVPLLGSQRATYDPRTGCLLEQWGE